MIIALSLIGKETAPMKETYVKPEAEVIEIEEDVITTSQVLQ